MTSAVLQNGRHLARPPSRPSNEPLRSRSRSPHPYHRRSPSLHAAQAASKAQAEKCGESSDSTESEERGTEADDEKGPILKQLPAPPLRGRKGLKGSKTPAEFTPAISPVPTPPAVDDKRASYFAADGFDKQDTPSSKVQELALEVHQKYVKRWRAEVARRGTEGGLLTLTAVVTSRNAFLNGKLEAINHEIYTSCAILSLVFLLFPLSIAFRRIGAGVGVAGSFKTGFRVPSRFDPGPLLYPVFLPFLIAISCAPNARTIPTANLVLGIASLPPKVIPFNRPYSHQYIRWVLSVTPLLSQKSLIQRVHQEGAQNSSVQAEDMVLLCPLHEAVLATLKYLTSTSLDPAEIQLLSTGLIDLYLFAASPQTQILKALLWIGPLCLFLLCRRPLSWEVTLARVPSWKFARNKSPRTGLLSLFESAATMVLPPHRYRQQRSWSSDDEDYEHLKSARRMAKGQLRLRKAKANGHQSDYEPVTIAKDKDTARNSRHQLQRSMTTSADGPAPPPISGRRTKSLNLPRNIWLSFTYTQAQACKWLISGYVYCMVLAIIMFLLRPYIGAQALSSHEPFGWAIGYLFGDIQALRLWVVSNNWDSWVSLPQNVINNVVDVNTGWVERKRQLQIGPANVRLLIAAYCIVILTTGISVVLRLGSVAEVDTRRKVFHGIMVAMLLPMIFIDPCFIALALALILAIFLLLDLFRASQLPPVSKPLTAFLAPYVDGRDYRGPVIVSHIFLLIGCAIPLWFSLTAADRAGRDPWSGWDTTTRDVGMVSGVICVGMGDAAASLIGRRYGRTKWFWGGGKSLEGSLAFAIAVTIGLTASYLWLRIGGWIEWRSTDLPVDFVKMCLASSGASVLESVLTAGNDNVIVPIGLWLLTRGLNI